jgi:hypothetical protein
LSLLGKAALAMWWDMVPEMKARIRNWHSRALSGDCRSPASAVARGGQVQPTARGYSSVRTRCHETLSSPAHAARLFAHAVVDEDDAASPQHGAQPMPRARVAVPARRGALTVRFSPAPSRMPTRARTSSRSPKRGCHVRGSSERILGGISRLRWRLRRSRKSAWRPSSGGLDRRRM